LLRKLRLGKPTDAYRGEASEGGLTSVLSISSWQIAKVWSDGMSDVTDSDKTDVQFRNDISDEALEAAALAGSSGAYTVAFCTNNSICPA